MTGRPRKAESDERRKTFIRLIAAGTPFVAAASEARIKPERALALLDTPEAAAIWTLRASVAA